MFLYHQDSPRVDFLPHDKFLATDRTDWSRRQRYFREWLRDQDWDQGPRGDAEFFATCAREATAIEGAILDLGGGDGYLRRWLPPSMDYVCLDPEDYPFQRSRGSSALGSVQSHPPPLVLRGVGEYLPFRDNAFRTLFCLGMLNHASSPRQVLQEVNRVLQPGGTLVLTLEEVPAFFPFRHGAGWRILKMSLSATFAKWRQLRALPWGLQPDHVAVRPSQVGKWLGERFRLQKTFFVASRGVVEMGQRWQKANSLPST